MIHQEFITAAQLVCHGFGDYVLQSDWMAQQKTKGHLPAAAHALTYCLPFLLLRPSLYALAFIVATHFAIDRWRLARYVVWAKNWLCPFWVRAKVILAAKNTKADGAGLYYPRMYVYEWRECTATGYPPEAPAWLAVWLLIIADNCLHILANGFALYYWP
jgi:hypothetical protein